MNLVGELVTNKVRLEQIGMTHRLTELTETLEQMDRVTTDLQCKNYPAVYVCIRNNM